MPQLTTICFCPFALRTPLPRPPKAERRRKDWHVTPGAPMSLLAGARLGRYSNLQPENARTLEVEVKATLKSHVVAESNDIVESGGYQYFPRSSVHMDWLGEAPKKAFDPA